MVVEWSLSIGQIGTGIVVIIGFISSWILNAREAGKLVSTTASKLDLLDIRITGKMALLDQRIERIEGTEAGIARALVAAAEAKGELIALTRRVDDLQRALEKERQDGRHR